VREASRDPVTYFTAGCAANGAFALGFSWRTLKAEPVLRVEGSPSEPTDGWPLMGCPLSCPAKHTRTVGPTALVSTLGGSLLGFAAPPGRHGEISASGLARGPAAPFRARFRSPTNAPGPQLGKGVSVSSGGVRGFWFDPRVQRCLASVANVGRQGGAPLPGASGLRPIWEIGCSAELSGGQ